MKKFLLSLFCLLTPILLSGQDFSYENPLMNSNYTIPVSAKDGTIANQNIRYIEQYNINNIQSQYSINAAADNIKGTVTSTDGRVTVYYTIEYSGIGFSYLWKITWVLPDGTSKTEYPYWGSESSALSEAKTKGKEYANEYSRVVPIGSGTFPILFAIILYYLYKKRQVNCKKCSIFA